MFFKNNSSFYRMTYLQMYIRITVWILHKTGQGEIIAQQEETWHTSNLNLTLTHPDTDSHPHTHTHWTPFHHIHIGEHDECIIHTMLQHGFIQGCGNVWKLGSAWFLQETNNLEEIIKEILCAHLHIGCILPTVKKTTKNTTICARSAESSSSPPRCTKASRSFSFL